MLSSNYALPQDACASYSLLFTMLQEFEDDLHIHIHLENNILFPKAAEMERSLAVA
jgi:regulator of cell morphogenesis and NO signaling